MDGGASHFVDLVKRKPEALDGVFNPWTETDPEHDAGGRAPEIRARQLERYFAARLATARFLLIGEAIGYQGGHFSGIAMTSERILLGGLREKGVEPSDVLPGGGAERTSAPSIKENGFTEPTATIVWGALRELGLEGTRFVLWNVFPWHPYHPHKGLLSNRKPRKSEVREGFPVLESFLGLFGGRTTVAVGKTAAAALDDLGADHVGVRHPAQGGAEKFRRQIRKIVGG